MIPPASLLRTGALRGGLTATVLLGAALVAALTLVKTVPDRVLWASLLALGLLLAGIAFDRAISAATQAVQRDPPGAGALPRWSPLAGTPDQGRRHHVLSLLGGPPRLIRGGHPEVGGSKADTLATGAPLLLRIACVSARGGRLSVRWLGGRLELVVADIADVAWSWAGVVIRTRDGVRWLLPPLRPVRPVTCSAVEARRALRLIDGWLARARHGSRLARRVRDALGLPADSCADTLLDPASGGSTIPS